jgi:hypothetical protein
MKHGHHPSSRARRDRETAAETALAVTPPAEDRDEFIRRTAYGYYEARGRIHGHELDDGLKADAEFERVSPPGRPEGENRRAQPEGNPMTAERAGGAAQGH